MTSNGNTVLGVRSSRKKYGGAIQRHFAGWNDLLYAVDTATGILIVRPATSAGSGVPIVVGLADTSVLRIPLRRITVSPHYYAPEGAHILSITCEAVGENGDTFGGYCWLGRGSDSSSVGSNSKSSEEDNINSPSTSSSSSSANHRHDVNTSDEGTYELYEKPLQRTNTTITTGQGRILKEELEIQLRLDSEGDLAAWQLALSEHIRQQQMAIDAATAVGLKAIASYLKKRLHLQSIYSLSEPFHADIQQTLSRSPFDLRPSHIPATTSPIKSDRAQSTFPVKSDRAQSTFPVKWAHGTSVLSDGFRANSVSGLSQQYREKTTDDDAKTRGCYENNDDDDKTRDEHDHEEDEDEYLVLREEDDYSIVDHTSAPPVCVAGNSSNNHNHNSSSRPNTTVARFLPSSMRSSPVPAPVPSSSLRAPLSVSAFSHRHTAAMPPLLSVDSKKSGGAFPDPLATSSSSAAAAAAANHVKSTPFSTPSSSSLSTPTLNSSHTLQPGNLVVANATASTGTAGKSSNIPLLAGGDSIGGGDKSGGGSAGFTSSSIDKMAGHAPFITTAHSRVMVTPLHSNLIYVPS